MPLMSETDESKGSGEPFRVQRTVGGGVPCTLQCILFVLPSSKFLEAGLGTNFSFSMTFSSDLILLDGASHS